MNPAQSKRIKDTRREMFAQKLASGMTAVDAYAATGFKRDIGNAYKMANRADVQARVIEITSAAAERAGVTCQRVIEELAKLAFANMMDYLHVGEDGMPQTDFSALTRDQAAAIAELVVETTPATAGEDGRSGRPEVRKVRFRLADKRGPLVDLGKNLGMFKERVEHSGGVTLAMLVAASYEKPGS